MLPNRHCVFMLSFQNKNNTFLRKLNVHQEQEMRISSRSESQETTSLKCDKRMPNYVDKAHDSMTCLTKLT